jgi:arginase family enzyme
VFLGLLDVKADSKAPTQVGVINIDAHFDVRPLLADNKAHSGSPFRQLLEDARFDGHYFLEFASQGMVDVGTRHLTLTFGMQVISARKRT